MKAGRTVSTGRVIPYRRRVEQRTMIQKEAHPRTDADVSVEAYVRARPVDREHRDSILEKLDSYLQDGLIADLDVFLWPKAVSLTCETCSVTPVDVVQEFEQWAGNNDASLEPAFETREVESDITGDRDRILSLPALCVALYHDDDLVGVFPSTRRDRSTSVADVVDALHSGDLGRLPVTPTVTANRD